LTVFLDSAISGNGSFHFGGVPIQYVLVHFTALGPAVFVSDLANPDQLLNAGYFSLGSEDPYGTGTNHVFWNERIWLNWHDFQWHPIPTVHPGDAPDLCVWASDIRWALSPGTTALMLVVGI